MSEIQVDESSLPDVEHTDAIETQPSIDHASLHAEAKTESNRGRVDVAAAWLALLLIVVGVVCALVLLGVALVLWIGYFPTKVTPGKTGQYVSNLVAAHVTMSDFGSTKNHLCQDQTRTMTLLHQRVENAVGAAPIWMRNTLLTAVAVKALAKVFGFDGSRQRSSTASRSQENLRASGTDGLLTSLLDDARLGSRADDISVVIAQQREQREQHERELQRVKSGGVGGLLRLLLTGHGLKPVPRLAASWIAITDDTLPQSTWHEARESHGLDVRQAIGVSITKLLLWHWSQPLAFLLVFYAYGCELEPIQVCFGLVVAAREVLYLTTTMAGIVACPVYLLLDVSSVWSESETSVQGCWRLAVYILTPHNYVALCLSTRFSGRGAAGSVVNPRHRKKMVCFGIVVACSGICAVFFWFASFVCWLTERNPAVFEHWLTKRESDLDKIAVDAIVALSWIPVLGLCLFVVARRNTKLRRAAWAHEPISEGIELDVMEPDAERIYDEEETTTQRQLDKKGLLSRAFLGLAFVQILADFSSCFALGLLLQEWSHATEFNQTPMLWGYAITACGFMFLFGPASVVASFKQASKSKESTENARPCARVGDVTRRTAIGCFGTAMLIGLLYIAIGVGLLIEGNDVRCWSYTGTSQHEWQLKCGEHAGCVMGACQFDTTSNAGALLAFKSNGNQLEGWTQGSEPCPNGGWFGVSCGGFANASVTELVLVDTAVTGDIGDLAALTQLTGLGLQDTAVTGDIGDLAALTQLTVLGLDNTAVTGDIGDLAALTQLTVLDLVDTAVTGDIGDLAALTQLTGLGLDNTAVTGCPLRKSNGDTVWCNK
eukprot:SAG11_NODE_526_length_8740_cov_27.364194_4_plen_831_part_00